MIMFLTLLSLILQITFRLYLYYSVNDFNEEESNDIFKTKTLLIMLLFYVIAPIFRRLLSQSSTQFLLPFFYTGQLVTIPLSIILTHQNTRNYFFSKYPKFAKLDDAIRKLFHQEIPHDVIE